MEEDPPVLPVAWGKINDVADYVKGRNLYDYFGIYDVVREDTFWLDKTLAPTLAVPLRRAPGVGFSTPL
jgi:hypothetical protein